jgi:hypothetical protein
VEWSEERLSLLVALIDIIYGPRRQEPQDDLLRVVLIDLTVLCLEEPEEDLLLVALIDIIYGPRLQEPQDDLLRVVLIDLTVLCLEEPEGDLLLVALIHLMFLCLQEEGARGGSPACCTG